MASNYGATNTGGPSGTVGYTRGGTPISSTYDVLLYFLAIFVPTIPVFLKRGCGVDVVINLCLWVLGWIPGVIHAWWIISRSEGAM